MATILVTGSTGTCGSKTIKKLRDQGMDVRAGVRNPKAAAELEALGAELVPLDFGDSGSLDRAFAGVERALLITPFVEEPMSLLRAAVEAAKSQGVSFLLRMSAAGANPDAEVALPRHHGEGEVLVRDSGVAWSAIRPSFFMDNFVNFQAAGIVADGAFYGASHGGRVAHISAEDIAASAAAILSDPGPHEGQTYELTGPAALSDADVADVIARVTGRSVKYVDLPDEELAKAMRERKTPEWMVEGMMYLEGVKAQGWAESVSPAVETLTGTAPESLESFIERHRSAFS